MCNQILVIGTVTPQQIDTVSREYTVDGTAPTTTTVTVKELFLSTDDLIEKYTPEAWTELLGTDMGSLSEYRESDEAAQLATDHVEGFGGPFVVVVLDEQSWVSGRRQSPDIWELLQSTQLWVAYPDGAVHIVETASA